LHTHILVRGVCVGVVSLLSVVPSLLVSVLFSGAPVQRLASRDGMEHPTPALPAALLPCLGCCQGDLSLAHIFTWLLFLACFSIAMETIGNSFSNSQCSTRDVYFVTHRSEWRETLNFWPLSCSAQPGCAVPMQTPPQGFTVLLSSRATAVSGKEPFQMNKCASA